MAHVTSWDDFGEGDVPISEKEFRELQAKVEGIDRRTQRIDEIFDVIEAMRGGLKVLEFLGRIAKPFVYIAAAFVSAYIFLRTGKWPL